MTTARRLIISPNWIGDAVMAQPLVQLLHQQDPASPIDVLAPSWVAPVWRAMREIDTVIEAPFKHGSLQLGERWTFARQLKQRGYSAAYVLPNTLKFALIPWLAGIPNRVGYKGESRYGLINRMHHDDGPVPRPMVSFYAALAKAPSQECAHPDQLPRPKLHIADGAREKALTELGVQFGKPMIAFAPGAEFGSAKRWPTTHFAQLAHIVRDAYPDSEIVLLGSAKDHEVCEEIAAQVGAVKNLAGVTTLEQALSVIATADAVVSNDSGLLHIASALNRPVIGLYGPTDPSHAPPFSDVAKALSLHLSCSPCKQRECPLGHQNCMKHLEAQMVWEPLRGMLQPG
ncbi:MAG TPA: lipopolysaccharide heptosyltransferase II [Burkholderiaceae bacterium]